MEIKKNKELYEAPSTLIFEVKTEGVICTSGDDISVPTTGAIFDDYEDGVFSW